MTAKKKKTGGDDLKLKIADLEQQLKAAKEARNVDVQGMTNAVDSLKTENANNSTIIEGLEGDIVTLKNQYADMLKIKEGYMAKVKELTDTNVELIKEKTGIALLAKKLHSENAALKGAHSNIKAAAIKAVGGNLDNIPVPALANKARAVSACRLIEELPSCSNLKDFILALRLFIEDHCK